ncbi:MAG: hypothetical protein WCG34_08655 [Leptolinea sp.]
MPSSFSPPSELAEVLHTFKKPVDVQAFLDATPYSPEERNRCAINVIHDRMAHCLDGGLFAALGLRWLGYPPVIIDLQPEPGMDDDHVLAIYRENGLLGAVAKSNFSGLRLREPVYRNMRELVMSYFEDFFNVDGVKTLRYYTIPLDLSVMDVYDWMGSDAGVDEIERRLKHLRKTAVVPAAAAKLVGNADALSYQAGMLGVNQSGLYKPKI